MPWQDLALLATAAISVVTFLPAVRDPATTWPRRPPDPTAACLAVSGVALGSLGLLRSAIGAFALSGLWGSVFAAKSKRPNG
jgi:hypothetical protein